MVDNVVNGISTYFELFFFLSWLKKVPIWHHTVFLEVRCHAHYPAPSLKNKTLPPRLRSNMEKILIYQEVYTKF